MLNFIKRAVAVLVVLCLCAVCMQTEAKAISVSAKGMVLINADTLEILDSYEPHKRLPMASTTKMMTALLLAETGELDKTIVTTREMVTVEGSSMGLLEGDTVSYYALLVGMMLPSGNDAANTAAICIAGSVEKFALLMNERAKKIGMKNTNFVTPSGLDDEEHYSTAYDMALLAAELLKNNVLREIVSSEKMTVQYGNPPYNRTLSNHNKLLGRVDECIGVKTGYTKKSGRCLVSAAENNDCTVIAVTLNASDDWNTHEHLLQYGLSVLSPYNATANVSDIRVPVVGASLSDISVVTDTFLCGVTDGDINFEYDINYPPFVYAPLKKCDRVGWIDYYYDGKAVHRGYLYAELDTFLSKRKSFDLKSELLINIRRLLKFCV